MKNNELNTAQETNEKYRYICHNGTRIKILRKGFTNITYNGTNYFVPQAKGNLAYISNITIALGYNISNPLENDAYEPISCLQEDLDSNLNMVAYYDKEELDSEACQDVYISIFRLGIETPIIQQPIKKKANSYNLVSEDDCVTSLHSGSYIAIISGANHSNAQYNHNEYIIYPFAISPGITGYKGARSASCRINGSHKTGSTDNLLLKIVHNDTLLNPERISYACFDSDMSLIAQDSAVIAQHNPGDIGYITIIPSCFWIENHQYTLVLGDQERAITSFSFKFANNERCQVRNHKDIEKIYQMAYLTIINNDNIHNSSFYTSEMSLIRPQVYALYADKIRHAELNKKIAGLSLPTTHNFVVINPQHTINKNAFSITTTIANILFDITPTFINCSELCKEDEWENLDDNDELSVWYNLDAMCNNRSIVLPYINAHFRKHNHVALLDTKDNIKHFFDTFPELTLRFDSNHTFSITQATAEEVSYKFFNSITAHTCKPIPETTEYIYKYLHDTIAKGGNLNKFTPDAITDFISNDTILRYYKRINNTPIEKLILIGDRAKSILYNDINWSYFNNKNENATSSITSSMNELSAMVGLTSIKEHIETLCIQLQFEQKRMALGLQPTARCCHHMIFTGNPGTGKTTVAKMIGKIFHALGILSKGDVIVTERSKLLGRYIGETEENMKQILKQAQGNVLFIDEAYTLCKSDDNERDFGHHVIEALLPILADEQADILIIMAGYEKEMENMMNINTGLKGRFPHKWNFDNYNSEELMQIAINTLSQNGYHLTSEANNALYEVITKVLLNKDQHFSNARWIKQQIFHSILPAMAKRVMGTPDNNDANFFSAIEAADIKSIETINKSSDRKGNTRNQIGFCTTQIKSKVA